MTVAVSLAAARGRQRGHLRVHRQHQRQRRRLRGPGRPGLRRAGAPRQDRAGQAGPGPGARRPAAAGRRQLRRLPGTGPQARRRLPGRAGQLGQPGPARGPEDGGVRDRATRSGDAPDVHCLPVGNAGNITAYWKGYREYRRRPGHPRAADVRLPGQPARRRSCPAQPVRAPDTIATAIRIGNPASWELAVTARDESRRADRLGHRRADPRRLPAAGRAGGRCSASWPRRPGWPGCSRPPSAARSPRGSRVVCTVTGNGLKDPDWAVSAAPAAVTSPRRRPPRRPRWAWRDRHTAGIGTWRPPLAGSAVRRAPATSANLGPGFDALGLALARHDVVERPGHRRRAGHRGDRRGRGRGPGRGAPRGAGHAGHVRPARRRSRPGSRCAAATRSRTAAGSARRRRLSSPACWPPAGWCPAVRTAARRGGAQRWPPDLEGHPDNVAACLAGSLTIAWTAGQRPGRGTPPSRRQLPTWCGCRCWSRSTRCCAFQRKVWRRPPPAARCRPRAAPGRGRERARSALLVAALTQDPAVLLDATVDFLHQEYRAGCCRTPRTCSAGCGRRGARGAVRRRAIRARAHRGGRGPRP